MERIGSDVGLERRYPAEFPLFEVGYKLNIKGKESSKDRFYNIANRDPVPKIQKYDSNWLIAKGGSSSLGDMSEWLETDEKKAVYCIAIGFRCDRELDITFKMPQSEDLYSTKGQHSIKLSPSDSPHDKPRLWFWTRGDHYIPSLEIENNTEYKPNVFEVVGRGFKYYLEGMESKPRNSHQIVLSHIGGSL